MSTLTTLFASPGIRQPRPVPGRPPVSFRAPRKLVLVLLVWLFGCTDAQSGEYWGDSSSDSYGWTEVGSDGRTRSFSLTPGVDPGESLETYLGSSVVYR